uniref:Uncharacterized protein n=1 Tax=Arundo donax TaxID=35708 RepID=A0A0A9FF15_ARUDO
MASAVGFAKTNNGDAHGINESWHQLVKANNIFKCTSDHCSMHHVSLEYKILVSLRYLITRLIL